jgi:hypothetical protein
MQQAVIGTSIVPVDGSVGTSKLASNLTLSGNTTFSGPLVAPAGTAGAPAFTTSGDTNTGLFFPAADTIGFAEGGTEVMRIDSSGVVNIGIGAFGTTPATTGVIRIPNASPIYARNADNSANRHVIAFNSSGQVAIAGDGNDTIIGTTSGNVGIGVSPVSQNGKVLQIDGGAGAADFRLTNNATGSAINNGTLLGLVGSDCYLWNLENAFLSLGTNNTERMRILSDGNIGIGTSSPASTYGAKLAVAGGNIIADFDRTIGFQWSGGLNQYSKGISGANQSSGSARGLHIFNYDNDASQGINFWGGTNASRVQLATITDVGTILLRGASAPASGVGIQFPATQSASSDANTLDDYEEGTWTPTVTAAASNPTVTYIVQTGFYTKIGRMVSIQGRLQINTISGGSGAFRLSGLPFTNAAGITGAGTSWFSLIDLSAGYTTASLYFAGNDNFLSLAQSGDSVGATQMNIGSILGSFDISFAFTYIV